MRWMGCRTPWNWRSARRRRNCQLRSRPRRLLESNYWMVGVSWAAICTSCCWGSKKEPSNGELDNRTVHSDRQVCSMGRFGNDFPHCFLLPYFWIISKSVPFSRVPLLNVCKFHYQSSTKHQCKSRPPLSHRLGQPTHTIVPCCKTLTRLSTLRKKQKKQL